jgi:hypothetical protein
VFQHRIIGFTDTENLPIHVVNWAKGERNILVVGQHHADEVLGVAISMHIIEELCRITKVTRMCNRFWKSIAVDNPQLES